MAPQRSNSVVGRYLRTDLSMAFLAPPLLSREAAPGYSAGRLLGTPDGRPDNRPRSRTCWPIGEGYATLFACCLRHGRGHGNRRPPDGWEGAASRITALTHATYYRAIRRLLARTDGARPEPVVMGWLDSAGASVLHPRGSSTARRIPRHDRGFASQPTSASHLGRQPRGGTGPDVHGGEGLGGRLVLPA